MHVSEILSQEEIDALLAAISGDDGDGSEAEGANDSFDEQAAPDGPRVKVYDFGRPNKLSKEQLRTLRIMHESFARGMATSLSGYLRTFVEAEVVFTDAMLYEEFARDVANPGIMAIFSIPPLEGSVVLEVTPEIGFAILDRLLGGPGTAPTTLRELTELEQPVVRRIVERMMDNLSTAWDHVTQLEPTFEQLELNPQFTQLVPPKEIVVVIGVEVRLREQSGRVNLCIPYEVIEPFVPKLSAHYLFTSAQRASTPQQVASLQKRLSSLVVPVSVLLGKAEVTVQELLELQEGDYIPLSTKATGPLPVLVGSRTKFWARPGRVGDRLAVELIAEAEDEEAMVNE